MNKDEGLTSKHPPRRKLQELEFQVKAVPATAVIAMIVLLIAGLVYGFTPPIFLGLILFISVLAAYLVLEHLFE